MENFTFKGKGVHYWRAQTERLTSFSDVVSWFQRQHGLSKARAIIAARRSRPEAYNEWRAKQNPTLQRMTRNTSSSRQLLSMRTKGGAAPLFNFRSL